MTLPWLPTLQQTFLLCVGAGGGKLRCLLHRQFLIRSKCALNLLSSPPNLEYEIGEAKARASALLKLGCEQRPGGPAQSEQDPLSLNADYCNCDLTSPVCEKGTCLVKKDESSKVKKYFRLVEISVNI